MPIDDSPEQKLPVPEKIQDAIRTLILWAGDDPSREGLVETPARVARMYAEVFAVLLVEDRDGQQGGPHHRAEIGRAHV